VGCLGVDVGLLSCGHDVGIWTGNQERLVAIIGPSHPIGRSTVGGVHREDLCPPRMVGDVAAFDDEPIAWLCVHVCLLRPEDRASRDAPGWRSKARIHGDGGAGKAPVICCISMLGFATAFKGSAAARVGRPGKRAPRPG